MSLKVGEKYLVVQLFGMKDLRIPLFKKQDRKENDPHFIGNGIVAWINEKKEPTQPKIEEELI